MTDLLKKYDQNLNFDFNDMLLSSGIASMVLVSLLTNKEVEDEKRDNAGSRTGLAIGSNLWVYRNQPKTDQVLEEMKLAAFESLEWMITEGIASDVEVAIGQSDLDKASLKIKIYKANSNKFKALWDDASGEAIKINPYGDQLEIGFE